jgi:hypothetical protein
MARKKSKGPPEDASEYKRYFRHFFASRPELLDKRTNDEVIEQWLLDHPDHPDLTPTARQALMTVKSALTRKAARKSQQARETKRLTQGAQGSVRPSEDPAPNTRYFRDLYKSRPELLNASTDEEASNQWLLDHPAYTQMPTTVRQCLKNVKHRLRASAARKQRRASETVQAGRSPDDDVRYFRRLFKDQPELRNESANEQVVGRWLADHPGHAEMPEVARQALLLVKLTLARKAVRGEESSEPQPSEEAQEDQAVESPADIKRYFRRFFTNRPELLNAHSNEEATNQWLADHPAYTELPVIVRQALMNVKFALRAKAIRKQRKASRGEREKE